MAITLDSGRQYPLVAVLEVGYAMLDAGAVTATTVFEAIDLPVNAIISGGRLVITEVINGGGATTIALIVGSDVLLADQDVKSAVGEWPLTPTGTEYTVSDTVDIDLALATSVASTGIGYVEIEYYVDGRANETMG